MPPPRREPLRTTLLRNCAIALLVGAALAYRRGGLARWPAATLLALWPTLGGHYVELLFRNHLRPRLPAARLVQAAARVAVWFAAGAALTAAMALTARALRQPWPTHWPPWRTCALGGLAFVGLECVVHLLLQLRGRPSFFNGRG